MPIKNGKLVQTPASLYALKHYPRGVKHGRTGNSVSRENNFLTQLTRSIGRTLTLGSRSRKGGKRKNTKRKTHKVRRNKK
jgi:hypothetical protein